MNQARETKKPLVLLFDEIDAIIRPDAGSAYSTVAGLFKQEIGRLCEDNKNIIVIATSNKHPNDIDEALFRPGRFDAHIYVPAPNDEVRKAIFGSLVCNTLDETKQDIFDIREIDLDRLAVSSPDMNGAAIKEIIRGLVASWGLRKLRTKERPDLINMQQILVAIEHKRTGKA
jgi:transitional endoplasmic reticulum ATPase